MSIAYAGCIMVSEKKKKVLREVSSHVNSDELERGILEYWEKEKIFERSLEQNKGKPLFTFYDGPPYATGKPHYGQILQSALKDTVLRYKTMRGYYVPRRVGWDTHGLPIENIVEKELGITSKREIEKDIEGFNKKCREAVFRYVDVFTAMLERIGRWADYDNAYSTLDRDYMESEWWVFKQLWDQKLVYKAFKSTPYCIRCATPLSNFEVSMGYKDKTDTAVYVLLRVRAERRSPLYLLVWTTTPWTLPGNTAVAISPELEYVTVEYQDKHIIIAKDLVGKVLGAGVEIVGTWKTEELIKMRYEPLYEMELGIMNKELGKDAYRIVTSELVTADEGTGIVHMAPAFGEEDHEISKQHGLPVLRTVDTLGNFVDGVEKFAGQNIFEANEKIIADLKERGLLLKQEQYTHSYPFCWRCDHPLIDYAIDSWFVKISELKDQMLKSNEGINWTPEHVKHGRFAKGIESAPDWAVSRNRFWSVPMPIWECGSCGERVCVGSIQELQELSGASDKDVEDIHRPYVDAITWDCSKCNPPSSPLHRVGKRGVMIRVTDVLDVWFDSGSMPYSQWHYPFGEKSLVEEGFPADFIVEAIEQTRAWFYTLHVLATALTKKDIGLGKNMPAYRNVIASGIILAEDGNKLSKKLKNYPEPKPTIEKYGADTIRMYFLNSTLGEPYQFSEKALAQFHRSLYLTLWNVYSFFVRYASVHNWQPGGQVARHSGGQSSSVLDDWILARTKQLEHDVVTHTDLYRVDYAARQFIDFVNDLSNWYVRRSRNRFQSRASEKERTEAFSTLHTVLVRLSKLLAPFMPFISEEIYLNLGGKQSVHLEQLRNSRVVSKKEQALLDVVKRTREIISMALAARAEAGIKVRQPLSSLDVSDDLDLSGEYVDMIKDEVNVDNVNITKVDSDKLEAGKPLVRLDTTITGELRLRGLARDIIRHGQVLRRDAGYALDDRITVVARTEDKDLKAVLKGQRANITNALQADEVVEQADQEDAGEDITIDGRQIHLGVVRRKRKKENRK